MLDIPAGTEYKFMESILELSEASNAGTKSIL